MRPNESDDVLQRREEAMAATRGTGRRERRRGVSADQAGFLRARLIAREAFGGSGGNSVEPPQKPRPRSGAGSVPSV